MTADVQSRRLFLQPSDVPAVGEDTVVVGVLNPAAIELSATRGLLIARVVQTARQTADAAAESIRNAEISPPLELPLWRSGQLVLQTQPAGSYRFLDPRVIQLEGSGHRRLTFASHLQVFRLSRPSATAEWTWSVGERLLPAAVDETYGLEDPRLTRVDDRLLMTAVAVSDHGVATKLYEWDGSETGQDNYDRDRWKDRGVIFVPENKDVVIFPERVGGKFWALHRPTPAQPFAPPEIWIASSDDLLAWGGHRPWLLAEHHAGQGRIGGGAVPIRVGRFWLIIYHASRRAAAGKIGRYVGTVALAGGDAEPQVLAVSEMPLFEPAAEWERSGFVSDVVFPTAVIPAADDDVDIFYGAADTCVGVVRMNTRDILQTHFPKFARQS